MGIADYFANLGNPSARKEIVRGAFTGAVKSPVKGTTTKSKSSAPFLAFAAQRSKGANVLATEAGFAPSVVEPTVDYPVGRADQPTSDAASIFRQTLLSDEGGIALPPHIVDGIMMNAYDESGGDPGIYGDNGAAVGLLQWNGDRQRALKRFADENGLQYNDPRLQGLFTKHELLTSERGAYEALQGTSTAGEAGAVFVDQYERPAEQHRLARRAKYLGGEGTADFTGAGVSLDYGPELSAVDPMSEELVGRSADNYSMGMNAGDFETLREKYGADKAMNILNTADPSAGVPYDDAILRFLREGAEEAAPESLPALPNGGVDLGPSAAGLSMGIPVSGEAAPASAPANGGQGGSTATASTKTEEEADKPNLTAVDRMMNAIYGTAVEDMDDDERADRRRAVGMAMGQGFQMLSRGTPMDIQPIVAQRMELQQMRRAAADLKKNAQGVSDMLVAAGMDELAQLPFMGENGMNAAMQTLATVATRSPSEGPFDVSPEMRATMAQTLSDMGYEGPAQLVMNTEAGPAFEEVWNNAVGATTRATSTAEGGATDYSPEQREAFARSLETMNNPIGAQIIRDGASPKVIDDLLKGAGGVATAGATAGQEAGARAAVEAGTAQRSAESLSAGYAAAGMEQEAIIAAAAASGPEATEAIKAYREEQAAAREQIAVAESGAALAEIVPDDLENAEEIKRLARAARTSEDRAAVVEMIAEDPKTTEQRLHELAKKDPEFLPFLTALKRAESGTGDPVPIATQLVINEVLAFGEARKSRVATQGESVANMEMLRAIAVNPDFDPGKVQEFALRPAQEWLTSVLGDSAPELMNDATLTGARMVEIVSKSMFAAATADLKGAVSDKETGYALATLPSVGDTRTQLLAAAQYHIKIAEIQDAEYQAILEWTAKAQKDGTLGDRNAMIAYVNEKVGHMKVFDQVDEKTMDAWFDDPKRKLGDVVQVVRGDGSSTYVSFTLE